MEKIIDSEIISKILVISDVSGENRIFNIKFETKDKEKYKISFDNVWDLRYSIENANLDRFGDFEGFETRTSDIVIVENSSYIKSYEDNALNFTYGIEDLKHYMVMDFTDTVVDILTNDKPKLEKIENEENVENLKIELEELRAWKATQDDNDKKGYGENKKSDFMYNILVITNISGGDGTFDITFETSDKKRYKLTFDDVWDLRYTIENANILRFKHVDDVKKDNSVFIVEDSAYIKEYQGTDLEFIQGLDRLIHYVVMDFTDTVVDILCTEDPTIKEIS